MSAKYDSIKKRAPEHQTHSRGFNRFIWFCVGLASGCVVSSMRSYIENMSWLSLHRTVAVHVSETKTTGTSAAVLPKPKLEFYTLLTKETPSTVEFSDHEATSSSPMPLEMTMTNAQLDNRHPPQVSKMERTSNTSDPGVVAFTTVRALEETRHAVESYCLQLASFKHRQDAEKMKVNLTMKGFVVHVVSATQGSQQWFRVVLGPFANKLEAQHTQALVMRREKIWGMIRLMSLS